MLRKISHSLNWTVKHSRTAWITVFTFLNRLKLLCSSAWTEEKYQRPAVAAARQLSEHYDDTHVITQSMCSISYTLREARLRFPLSGRVFGSLSDRLRRRDSCVYVKAVIFTVQLLSATIRFQVKLILQLVPVRNVHTHIIYISEQSKLFPKTVWQSAMWLAFFPHFNTLQSNRIKVLLSLWIFSCFLAVNNAIIQ